MPAALNFLNHYRTFTYVKLEMQPSVFSISLKASYAEQANARVDSMDSNLVFGLSLPAAGTCLGGQQRWLHAVVSAQPKLAGRRCRVFHSTAR
jgi:hypothetical protein